MSIYKDLLSKKKAISVTGLGYRNDWSAFGRSKQVNFALKEENRFIRIWRSGRGR